MRSRQRICSALSDVQFMTLPRHEAPFHAIGLASAASGLKNKTFGSTRHHADTL